MKTAKTHSPQELYANLGFLLYSIAASDHHVVPAEVARLKEEVKAHWHPLEPSHDEFGTELTEYMEISFDHAADEQMTSHEAFDRFQEYYASERDTFDRSTKSLILRTAIAIAASKSGINRSEHAGLARLMLLFNGPN